MDRRSIWALTGVAAVAAAALGYSLPPAEETREPARKVEVAEVQDQAGQRACASAAAYNQLKQAMFSTAAQNRPADSDFDALAASSVVRMENPVVTSRDPARNVTVCEGRIVLEVPPGAERGLGGQRRLAADIEYIAQPAADGSGLVYRLTGAEPIVARLAAFDLGGEPLQTPGEDPQVTELAENDVDTDDAEPVAAPPPPARQPAPVARPVPPQPKAQPAPTRTASSNPSFNCRNARTRSERMVCSSDRLAARDRAMSARYFSALSRANPRARRVLEQTRGRFLAYRERCPDAECIEEAYEGRMEEIDDIMEDLN
ncbi:MAG TPA: hypothetical protein VGD10_10255 [Allosphingosinicella sp.]|uniref:lysozyme inhibitor LprI family protein n=1 Tax=Allosphingosinicella sp. TaxID=2823234 RepID=UPI002EDA46F4